jgi:hypothetical protein
LCTICVSDWDGKDLDKEDEGLWEDNWEGGAQDDGTNLQKSSFILLIPFFLFRQYVNVQGIRFSNVTSK